MSETKFTIDDIEKALEITKAMAYEGIHLADWDNENVEVEYLDRKEWHPTRRAAEIIYAALPARLVKPS